MFNKFTSLRNEAGNDGSSGGGGAAGVEGSENTSAQTAIVDSSTGALSQDWYTGLEGISDNTDLSNFGSLQDLASKALLNDEAINSARDGYVQLPGEGADENVISKFNKAIGIPETHEGYDLNIDNKEIADSLPEGELDMWSKFMHEAGVPKAAAQTLLAKRVEGLQNHQTQFAAQAAKADAQTKAHLATKWGGEDQVAVGLEEGKAALLNIGVPDELVGEYLSNPIVAELAREKFQASKEGQLPGKGVTAGPITDARNLVEEAQDTSSSFYRALTSSNMEIQNAARERLRAAAAQL